jgi:hypothetical protein
MNALTNFGGGSLGLFPTSFHSFLLALDREGKHRRTKTNAGMLQIVEAGEAFVYMNTSLRQFDFLGALLGLPQHTSEEPRFLAMRKSDFGDLWQTPVDLSQGFYPHPLRGFSDGTFVGTMTHIESAGSRA